MTSVGVVVHGDEEVARALRDADRYLEDEIRRTNMQVAEEVAREARAAASGLGSTAAHVAPSVETADRGDVAEVAIDTASYPMAAGAEFGSSQYPQFQPFRGSGDDGGYFLYPTIRRREDEIDQAYTAAADTSLRRAGLR